MGQSVERRNTILADSGFDFCLCFEIMAVKYKSYAVIMSQNFKLVAILNFKS